MNTTSSNRISSIARPEDFCLVVGLTFSDASAYAFEWAAQVAGRVPGGTLHLLHVLGGVHVLGGAARGAYVRELSAHLRLHAMEKLKSMLPPLTGLEIGVHVRPGRPVPELARFAREVGADLIVLGCDSGPFRSWFVEPTFERLLALASCPVVVAGPRPQPAERHEPVIEPPCPDCVRSRAASGGAIWWCARHSKPVRRAHTFSYHRALSLRSHDSAVTPTGIDME